MWLKSASILISFVVITISGSFCLGDCPSADLTGDCLVDFEDFALMANQWLTTDPCIPDDFVYIPDGYFQMGDSFSEGNSDELPVHTVQLDSFAIGKFEVTNQEYCKYLNSAHGSSIYVSGGTVYGTGNNQPYCDISTSDGWSQIAFSGGVFSVRAKDGRDMFNDPMVAVAWFGAAAYCNWRSQQDGYEQCYNLSTWTCDFNKHGYRLATEAEWEYAARGGLSGKRFPWGNTISQTQADFHSSSDYSYDVSPTKGIYHPLWGVGDDPYTSPVGFFNGTKKYKAEYQWPGSATSYQTTSGANNYGLSDMAGNVWEWCNDWYSDTYYSSSPLNNPPGPTSGSYRVFRGGAWINGANYCRVAYRIYSSPTARAYYVGFRLVLDLN